jgi:AcrR family transcriptional regulator
MPAEARSKAERAERTRARLVDVARALFAEHGYAGVGLSEIVARAEVTKGALYHHFGSKLDLFRAVTAQIQMEVGDRVAAAADAHDDPWAQLLAGCRAFLDASADPEARQIMLVDGPAVLGWSEWREQDAAASRRHLAEAITGLVDTGLLAPQPVEPVVHLLSGAMNEAAMWLAESADPADRDRATAALTRMIEGLRV